MEIQTARQIIETLAQGIHPVTGECMPEDSPYNAPPVIRALFAVSQALDHSVPESRQRRLPPPNAGKTWSEETDAALVSAFERGESLKAIAEALGRTRFGIEQRLIRLGRVQLPGGARQERSSTG